MLTKYIPTETTEQMHQKYEAQGLLRQWKDFLDAGKNTFLRNCIYERQQHICPVCGQIIESIGAGSTIHHLTYDNYCSYSGDKIKQLVPTYYKPNRWRLLPDCHNCALKNPEGFKRCQKLVLTHKSCHAQIHLN